jgi:hypothetical protein
MSKKAPHKNRKERRAKERQQAERSSPQISYWTVAFLDLMGYSDVLGGLDVLPFPTDEAGVGRMTESLARARRLRRRLHDSFKQFMVGHERADVDLGDVPPHLKATVRATRATHIVFSGGPDHIMLAASLALSPTNFPARSVFSLVTAAASGMLIHLAIGSDDPTDSLPLRGGIDIAAGGVVHPEPFPFTPALSRAYKLESKEAEYPRTLVGDRMEEYLSIVSSIPGDDFATDHARQVADRVRSMFFMDDDGKRALDFYGPVLRDSLETNFAQDLGQRAWTYAKAAEGLARSRGDAKVIGYYQRLLAYMEPRRRHWA